MQELTLKDWLLLAQLPVVAVPTEATLERLERNGQRLLLAANGIFLEIRRHWLYAVRRCGELHPHLQTPFGAVTETTDLAGEQIPRRLIEAFVDEARKASPLEVGAIIAYDIVSGEWALRMNRSLSASPVRLNYEIPDLRPTEHRVVDIHSHGEADAFLSVTDLRDTRGSTAIVMVVGKVSDAAPHVVAYLYLHGMRIRIPWSQSGDIDAATMEEQADEFWLDETALG